MDLEANQEEEKEESSLSKCLSYLICFGLISLAGYVCWKLKLGNGIGHYHHRSHHHKSHHHRRDVYEYIDRDEWGAFEPTETMNPLTPPVKNVVFYHIPTLPYERDVNTNIIKDVQSMYMGSTGWPDIEMNFLVGSDGEIFVGRGWDVQPEPQSGHETESIAIAFLGMFEQEEPTERQTEAANRLLENGVQLQSLDPDYHIYDKEKFGLEI